MARKITVIPKAPFGRILMKAGAKRVAAGAVDVFTEILTEMTEKIAIQSVRIAKHSGRKTVHEGDIRLAAKQWLNFLFLDGKIKLNETFLKKSIYCKLYSEKGILQR